MKCESCGIDVNPSFTYAFKTNKCPGCGNSIVVPENMAVYKEVNDCLEENQHLVPDFAAIAAALLIKFDMRLRTSIVETPKAPALVKRETDVSTKTPDEISDEEYKKAQMEEARRIKQMRDEALNGALADQWGLGGEIFSETSGEDSDIRKYIDGMKKEKSIEAFKTGGAAFRRGGR